VRGEVVAIEQVVGSRGDGATYPIVKYIGERGEQRTFRPRVAALALVSVPSVGETVDVLYDETNPDDARIVSFWGLYYLPTVFGGIAALLFGWAVRVLMRAPG